MAPTLKPETGATAYSRAQPTSHSESAETVICISAASAAASAALIAPSKTSLPIKRSSPSPAAGGNFINSAFSSALLIPMRNPCDNIKPISTMNGKTWQAAHGTPRDLGRSCQHIGAEEMPQHVERQSVADGQSEPLAPSLRPVALAGVRLRRWGKCLFRLRIDLAQQCLRVRLRRLGLAPF